MPDNWDTWTDEHKAEVVATKVMGWQLGHGLGSDMEWRLNWSCVCPVNDYRPTENIAQAWEVQAEIDRRGLGHGYTRHLLTLCLPVNRPCDWMALEWLKFKATADQRCHAAVLAVKGES